MTTTTQSLLPAPAADRRGRLAGQLTRFSAPALILIGIMLLAAVLNFANIDALGDGNTYYTAAIEAMLQSPSNFFFIAAEPGGSVTIDKPPLGLWLQAISAMLLGVNGFAVVLPQILAGIFSLPLLYGLVKRYAGSGAGLIAALVLAIMPVSVAVQRNNTMDATLIFTLLLAAWAFVKATDTGKLRWLLLGGVLVGLGFNIKMLQAFLPLPAFYGLYFLAAKTDWRRKIVHLALTTVVLLTVSLAWVIAVDLTPADQRPYVGSSTTNSALELAIGYNGLQRLLGGAMGGGAPTADGADGQRMPPNGMTPPNGMPGGAPGTAAGGGMFGSEIGSAGVLRLVTQPLDNEIGWLLPFSLIGLGLLVIAARPRLPLSQAHQAAILWGGWLLTEIVFFSAASFFHAYYLAMLTPPLAALVGIGVMRLWGLRDRRGLLALALLLASVGATLVYQYTIAAGYTTAPGWMLIPAAALVIGGGLLLAARLVPRFARLATAGLVALVFALTFTPAVWAAMGTAQGGANIALPAAYSGNVAGMPGNPGDGMAADGTTTDRTRPDAGFAGGPGDGATGSVDADLLTYLQANTAGMRYMMAVPGSMQGAAYVLATGRGVLYMGGFSGQDPVVDADALQSLVDAGELRYILSGGAGGRGGGMTNTDSDITTWLTATCTVVTEITTTGGTLYDCAGS